MVKPGTSRRSSCEGNSQEMTEKMNKLFGDMTPSGSEDEATMRNVGESQNNTCEFPSASQSSDMPPLGTNGPGYPVLHLTEADLNNLNYGTQDIQVNGVALDMPTLLEPIGSEVVVSSATCISEGKKRKASPRNESAFPNSDDDFEDPSKKSKSQSQGKPKTKTPSHSQQTGSDSTEVRGGVTAGQATTVKARQAGGEAGPSNGGPSTSCYEPLIPAAKLLTGKGPAKLPLPKKSQGGKGASMLKALLTDAKLLSGGKSTSVKPIVKRVTPTNRRQVTKRASVTKPTNNATASSKVTTTAVEIGRSTAVLPATPSGRNPIQSSDSESDLEIFSQGDERDLVKRFLKLQRNFEREYLALNETIQGAELSLAADEKSLRTVDADLRAVDADLLRLEEERRRLEGRRRRMQDRRQDLVASIPNSQRTLEINRGSLDKALRKKRVLDKKN